MPPPPQHLRGREADGTAADDHDSRGRVGRRRLRCRLPAGILALPTDKHLLVIALDSPAGDRIEGRGAERLAGAQAEAGVVPRTADRISDYETFLERPAVMRARRAHRE
jgi:hypothetical protein